MIAGAMIFLGFCLIVAAFIFVSVKIFQIRPDFIKKVLKYALILVFTIVFSIVAITIGFRVSDRHSSSYSSNLRSVQEIWGGEIVQELPTFSFIRKEYENRVNRTTGETERILVDKHHNMGIEGQKVLVDIKSNIREKGLLKYPGFNLTFNGKYQLKNLNQNHERLYFSFPLPRNAGNITDINVKFQDKDYTDDPDFSDGIQWNGILAKDEIVTFEISYNAQGTETFNYAMGTGKSQIKNLDVKLITDFKNNIITDGAMVPTSLAGDNNEMAYVWQASNLVTGQSISLRFKISGNYGRIVSKLFYNAPIALFLFIGLLLVFSVSKNINLHPMHYLFMIIGFFIFYLLGSYMISYMNVIIAILISLMVSTGIIIYYTYLIKKGTDIIKISSYGIFLFQWVFSTAFFVPEHTGFLITIASIIAFIFLMRSTASIDWTDKW